MINWCKNKTHINLVIDAIMFLVLMAISGLGLLMKYILIPGFKRAGLYENDVDFYFLGLTRHDWGEIHLWLAYIFLFLLVLHLIFHWKMIICIFRQMISGKSLRISIASLIGVAGLFLLLSPLFIEPDSGPSTRQYRHRSAPPGYLNERFNRGQYYRQKTNRELLTPENINSERFNRGQYYRHRSNQELLTPENINSERLNRGQYYRHRSNQELLAPENINSERFNRGQYYRHRTDRELLKPENINRERRTKFQESSSEIIRIYAYMTLDEVSENHNISVHKLAEELNIPVTETNEKLIDLRKKYNFLLPDVRKAVRKLQQTE